MQLLCERPTTREGFPECSVAAPVRSWNCFVEARKIENGNPRRIALLGGRWCMAQGILLLQAMVPALFFCRNTACDSVLFLAHRGIVSLLRSDSQRKNGKKGTADFYICSAFDISKHQAWALLVPLQNRAATGAAGQRPAVRAATCSEGTGLPPAGLRSCNRRRFWLSVLRPERALSFCQARSANSSP
jgi:hypothetical protein